MSCFWSDQSKFMAVLWFLMCGFFQVLFLTLVVNFNFFSSHFLVTTLRLDLFTGAYFKKLLVFWCPVIGNNLIQGVYLVRCFLACKWKQLVSGFLKHCIACLKN